MRNPLRTALIIASLSFSGALWAAPVNVNTASAQEIAEALKGVGPKKAEAIVDYRKANGPFKKVEDLTEVKGIGDKTLEANRQDIQI